MGPGGQRTNMSSWCLSTSALRAGASPWAGLRGCPNSGQHAAASLIALIVFLCSDNLHKSTTLHYTVFHGIIQLTLLQKATCLFDYSIRVALLHCNTFLAISLMSRTSYGPRVKFAGKSVLVKHVEFSGNWLCGPSPTAGWEDK